MKWSTEYWAEKMIHNIVINSVVDLKEYCGIVSQRRGRKLRATLPRNGM